MERRRHHVILTHHSACSSGWASSGCTAGSSGEEVSSKLAWLTPAWPEPASDGMMLSPLPKRIMVMARLVSLRSSSAATEPQEEAEENEGGAVKAQTPDPRGALVTRPTQLLDAILAAGRKGLSVQRYKGLGEMNADQLWETTLDPTNRALLQVEVSQADVADEIFTRLMGDVVEPRRDFIQENALNVANLDV